MGNQGSGIRIEVEQPNLLQVQHIQKLSQGVSSYHSCVQLMPQKTVG